MTLCFIISDVSIASAGLSRSIRRPSPARVRSGTIAVSSTLPWIGHADVSVVSDPERWKDWGAPREALQYIKYLWHTVVRYGYPIEDW